MTTRAIVLADTHIQPGRNRRLPDEVYAALDRADLVFHAGDIVTADLVHELSGFAPVHAVLGNNDDGELAGMLPATLTVEVDGVRVAMIHDSGARDGRGRRLRAMFPDADVVVYGHSHIPFCGDGVDGQLLFNPGSPTDKRRQPFATYGVLELAAGAVTRAEIVSLRGG